MYIRIFVSERKTHVYGGQWIDAARPLDGSFGVFDAPLLGKGFSAAASSCLTSTHLGTYTLIAPWSTTATCFTYATRWRLWVCPTTRRSSLRRTLFALVLPPRRSTLARIPS